MVKNSLVICMLAVVVSSYAIEDNSRAGNNSVLERKILVEEFKDRMTGCVITYEYYKSPEGKKILHGKYKRQWSIPRTERGGWSGKETVTATFVDNKLNGIVIINCEKYKWKRKNEYIKGKGRKVSLVPVESYVVDNLKIEVRNDTLAGTFNFELGNLKYEARGRVNESGEMQGRYILYRKNTTEQTDNPRNIGEDWVIEEQYLCDPGYTYKDVIPKVTEVNLGYPGTSRGEQIHIKIPRLRLDMSSQ